MTGSKATKNKKKKQGPEFDPRNSIRTCFPRVPIEELLGERRGSRALKLSESVAREIVREIRTLPSGAALPPEAVMMQEYDVGRPTLREALRILEVQGLIVLKRGQGGGPIVAGSSPEDLARMLSLHLQASSVTLNELLAARVALEPVGASLAATARSDDDLKSLWKLLERHLDPEFGSVSQQTIGTFYVPWQDFHSAVAAMSGNPITSKIIIALQSLTVALGTSLPAQTQFAVHSDHEGILRAIEDRDGGLASELMFQHLSELVAICYADIDEEVLAQPIEWQ